jgi:hypothetical protein
MPVMGQHGRVWLAGLCGVAGVAVLAGPGWALLAAALVFYLTPLPSRVTRIARLVPARAVRAWRWLVTGRHQVAMSVTPVAIVLVPVGAGFVAGLGWALIVFGLLVLGLALLLGWDPARPAR